MSHEGRGLKWCVEKPRTAEDCHQKQGERHGTDSPLQLLKEPTLPMPWFWTTSLRDCEAISCPIYGTLLWQPEETNPHLHQSRWTWFSVGLFEVRDCTLFDFGSSGLLQYLAGKSNTSEIYKGFLGGSVVKNLPSNERTQVQTLVWKVRSCMPQLRPAAAKNNVS